MAIKFYEDEELKEYFKYCVGKMEVAPVYKRLLVDILMRRAHEYELSEADITQDMRSLSNNLKSIEIKELPSKFNSMGGVYNAARKTITLNARYLDQLVNNRYDPKLYEILTHEVYHALSRDKDGKDRLASINSYTKRENYSLLEVIVEKAADRCVYPRGNGGAPYYTQNTYGYADITFLTDAIEATYGVKEKEFLREAIMGRDRMIRFLAKSGNEHPRETAKFLDAIEASFERLHLELYPPKIGSKKKLTPEEFEQKIDVIKASMVGIYNWCETKFADRIENTPLGGLREASRFENEAKYNHNKLTFVLGNALYRFTNKYNRPDIYNDVTRAVEPAVSETTDRISDIDSIITHASKLSLADAITLINESRHGNLYKYARYVNNFGIRLKSSRVFPENSRTVDEYYNTDFRPDIWENDEISNYMARRLPSYVSKGNKVLNAITMMMPFSFRKELLPEGEVLEVKNDVKEAAFAALSKAERDRINKQSKEMIKVREKTKERTSRESREEK